MTGERGQAAWQACTALLPPPPPPHTHTPSLSTHLEASKAHIGGDAVRVQGHAGDKANLQVGLLLAWGRGRVGGEGRGGGRGGRQGSGSGEWAHVCAGMCGRQRSPPLHASPPPTPPPPTQPTRGAHERAVVAAGGGEGAAAKQQEGSDRALADAAARAVDVVCRQGVEGGGWVGGWGGGWRVGGWVGGWVGGRRERVIR